MRRMMLSPQNIARRSAASRKSWRVRKQMDAARAAPVMECVNCTTCGDAMPHGRADRYCLGCRSTYMKAWRAKQWRAPRATPRPQVLGPRCCSRCRTELPRTRADAYCVECRAAYGRAYRKSHPRKSPRETSLLLSSLLKLLPAARAAGNCEPASGSLLLRATEDSPSSSAGDGVQKDGLRVGRVRRMASVIDVQGHRPAPPFSAQPRGGRTANVPAAPPSRANTVSV